MRSMSRQTRSRADPQLTQPQRFCGLRSREGTSNNMNALELGANVFSSSCRPLLDPYNSCLDALLWVFSLSCPANRLPRRLNISLAAMPQAGERVHESVLLPRRHRRDQFPAFRTQGILRSPRWRPAVLQGNAIFRLQSQGQRQQSALCGSLMPRPCKECTSLRQRN